MSQRPDCATTPDDVHASVLYLKLAFAANCLVDVHASVFARMVPDGLRETRARSRTASPVNANSTNPEFASMVDGSGRGSRMMGNAVTESLMCGHANSTRRSFKSVP